jgi:hypothetical protein
LCAAGTYSPAGQSSCTPCPTGTSSSIRGATSVANCTSCPAGTYCDSATASPLQCDLASSYM